MNRRNFCKYASAFGGALVLSPLINACSRRPLEPAPLSGPTSAPSPSATASETAAQVIQPATATVAKPTGEPTSQPTTVPATATPTLAATAVSQLALVRDDNRARGVANALALLDLAPLTGKSVLLKPNFNSADPSPGSTHPDILRALLAQLKELRAGQITLADRSGMGDTRSVMEQIGVFDLINDFDCRTLVLDELAEDEWVLYRQAGLHWQDGFPIPRLLGEADSVIQTCNLKTHRYGGHFTMSLKNSVGLVAKTVQTGGYNYMTELHNSPYQRLMIAEVNMAYEPDLIVMDGVEAFVSGGPANGERVKPGVILAGRDRVAMDAAGVAILRLFGTTAEVSRGRVFDQEQIARAAELGLGAAWPEQIEFITADEQSAEFAGRVRKLLLA
jgi:uncharacterized protein (DUF362 family)